MGWLVFRSRDSLPDDLVFHEDYLGKRDATFTLNFSTGSGMVLAQYFNFIRFGRSGYEFLIKMMQANTERLAEQIKSLGPFELIGSGEQLPLVAFKLTGDQAYDEFDVAAQLAAERGWMVPAYHLPPNAQEEKLMRALVKLTLTHSLAEKLAEDMASACETLERKGGVDPSERKRVHTATGY
ncbi:MAG TPA: pyridoxal-dependent decarboxylase [Solirubrobacterales bacterium]|nr:pyridoxal-dependent decarboxylase [Solirubrobacterales bacterium]